MGVRSGDIRPRGSSSDTVNGYEVCLTGASSTQENTHIMSMDTTRRMEHTHIGPMFPGVCVFSLITAVFLDPR